MLRVAPFHTVSHRTWTFSSTSPGLLGHSLQSFRGSSGYRFLISFWPPTQSHYQSCESSFKLPHIALQQTQNCPAEFLTRTITLQQESESQPQAQSRLTARSASQSTGAGCVLDAHVPMRAESCCKEGTTKKCRRVSSRQGKRIFWEASNKKLQTNTTPLCLLWPLGC